MKKVFLAMAVCLTMCFVLTSCSGDDKDEMLKSLSGTNWSYYAGGNSIILSFKSGTLYRLSLAGPDIDDIDVSGLYTYSKPNLTLIIGSGSDAEEISGVVEGDELTLIIEGYALTLIRD
jgi:hypothetical protein